MKKMKTMLAVLLALAMVICVAPAAFAEGSGTDSDPYVVEHGDFGFNTEIITSAEGSVYFTFTSPVDGYLFINSTGVFSADGNYDILWDCASVYVSRGFGDEHTFDLNNMPTTYVSPIQVWAEEPVVIEVAALDAAGNPMAAMVCFEGAVAGLSADNPIQFQGDNPASIMLNPGSTVYLRDYNGAWAWCAGMVISTSNGSVGQSVVYMNDKQIVDEDGDGTLEFVPERSTSDMMGAVILGIQNGTGMRRPVSFIITQTDTPQTECAHTVLVDIPAVAPDCHAAGVLAHKKCENCGTLFNAEGAAVTEYDLVDPAANSLNYVFGTVTCTEPGIVEHYHCDGCGKNYADYEGLEELADINSDAMGHNAFYMDPVDPECWCEGSIGYYYCGNCYQNFADEELTEVLSYEETVIPMKDHDWVPVGEVVPSCGESVTVTYQCSSPMHWEAPTKEVTHAPHTLTLEYVPEVPPVDEVEGTKEHWVCTACGKLFADAEAKVEVSAEDLVIAGSDGTGDPISIVLGLTMLSGGAVLTLGKKKF